MQTAVWTAIPIIGQQKTIIEYPQYIQQAVSEKRRLRKI